MKYPQVDRCFYKYKKKHFDQFLDLNPRLRETTLFADDDGYHVVFLSEDKEVPLKAEPLWDKEGNIIGFISFTHPCRQNFQ